MQQNGEDEDTYNNAQSLYVTRIATENTIDFVKTDNDNDKISEKAQPAKSPIRDTGYPNMYEVQLVDGPRERIELEEEIIWSLSELTENSKGIINTESDELKTLFEKLFICSSIILSNKWKYENARNIIYKSNDNMKKMEAKQNIGVFQSKIKSEYKNLYNLIFEIINRKTR